LLFGFVFTFASLLCSLENLWDWWLFVIFTFLLCSLYKLWDGSLTFYLCISIVFHREVMRLITVCYLHFSIVFSVGVMRLITICYLDFLLYSLQDSREDLSCNRSSASHACRKRRLNGVVHRMRPEKPRSHVTVGVTR
jgi:hypothetical protein